MRHGNKVNHLGRKTAHRKALMKNMAIALLISPKKRIFTTVAKAKALRQYVEPLITRSKDNTTHSRRMAFSYLQNKEAVKELFGDIAAKVGDRPGGYTRILKIGNRVGDNAEMALIELVDFNEFATEKPKKKTSRRRKRPPQRQQQSLRQTWSRQRLLKPRLISQLSHKWKKLVMKQKKLPNNSATLQKIESGSLRFRFFFAFVHHNRVEVSSFFVRRSVFR